jgi:hypothetical protein
VSLIFKVTEIGLCYLKLEKGERGRDWSEERDLWDGKGGGGREF